MPVIWPQNRSYASPIVSGVVATPNDTGASIHWDVSPDSYGRVEYGPTTAYGSLTTAQVSPLPSHTQVISGLTAATLYHFRIWTDAGNTNPGIDFTFTTTGGTVFCGVSLQAMIDAAASGSTLDLTGCTYTAGATINKPLTLVGATWSVTSGVGLSITSSNVAVKSCTITGPDPTAATYVDSSRGINITATAAAPLSGIVIQDCIIDGWSGYGIRLQNVVSPTIGGVGHGNTITDLGYTGIMLLSCLGGTISYNTVRRCGVNTNVGNGEHNAYGITASRQSSSEPVSNNLVVQFNIVSDVPNWHGLDTHAGTGIQWLDNHVSRCNRAVFLTGDSFGAISSNNTFSRNTLDEPTRKVDVPNYAYNEVGLTVVVGVTGTTGTGNFFDGWPFGNAVNFQGGATNTLTNSTITNSY